MARQITYSARFKRDYVAALAVVIFFAIVIAEITLAISIPAYLKRENAMVLEVRRLRLLESFDGARNMSEKLKVKGGETAELEARLVAWGLNTLAPYLREHSGSLSGEEISGLQNTVTEFTRIMARLRDAGPYCIEQTLDTGIYIDARIPQEAK
ncbi:MAG: hypothetical protein HPZ91_06940 [Lentisphaeria bacterium]|nr:hypothetical protein [Lentisphaeria bacterium]